MKLSIHRAGEKKPPAILGNTNARSPSARGESMPQKVEARDLESWVSLFEPDTLTSFQYYEKWRHRRYPDPEKMLVLAVLEDAITCFQKFSSAQSVHGKARFQEEEDWFFHERSDRLFSFEKVCEVLDLNPGYIRAGLTRWRSGPPARIPRFVCSLSFGLAEEHKSKPFDRGKGTAVVTTPPNPNQVIAVYVRATYRLHKLNSEVQVAGFHSIHARQKRHDEERPFIVITRGTIVSLLGPPA